MAPHRVYIGTLAAKSNSPNCTGVSVHRSVQHLDTSQHPLEIPLDSAAARCPLGKRAFTTVEPVPECQKVNEPKARGPAMASDVHGKV
jgi:hypothetical protein